MRGSRHVRGPCVILGCDLERRGTAMARLVNLEIIARYIVQTQLGMAAAV